jgi:UDPglucose 6-dehydrogenase
MRIAVQGLWHLGSVTAACLAAAGHTVSGLDEDSDAINRLSRGEPPIFEPGLHELVKDGLSSGRLTFTDDAVIALAGAEVVWITYDTPVDDNDVADSQFVVGRVERTIALAPKNAFFVVSSQLPIGSISRLEREAERVGRTDITFGCSPENLRLGKAIEVFNHPDRVVVGVRRAEDAQRFKDLMAPITSQVLVMGVESAEMTKHAINSFLAIFLSERGRENGIDLTLIPSVAVSNGKHKAWAINRIRTVLGSVKGRSVTILGLTYKPGTDTLRRSSSIELARALVAAGAEVRAFDPAVRSLPSGTDLPLKLMDSVQSAVFGADAIVIGTEWPEFRSLDWASLTASMSRAVVIDANGLLAKTMSTLSGLTYASVGRVHSEGRPVS